MQNNTCWSFFFISSQTAIISIELGLIVSILDSSVEPPALDQVGIANKNTPVDVPDMRVRQYSMNVEERFALYIISGDTDVRV